MTEQNTNFQFKVTNVTGQERSFATKQSIKKRIADIVYVNTPPDDAVKLEYVGSTELTPSVNIFIGDRSDEIYANSRNNTIQEIISDKDHTRIPVANKNFVITQEFIEDSVVPIPLFYKTFLGETVVPESIRILDKNGDEVSKSKYKVSLSNTYNQETGVVTGYDGYWVFNSIENTYDYVSGDYEAYYIQYTTRVAGVETVHTTILDNELAYQEATYSDYWDETPGQLKPWVMAYMYTSEEGSYQIALPPGSAKERYAIRYLEANRISVKHPVDFTDMGPWYPRIANAGFVLATNVSTSQYDIKEFDNQGFNPVVPYKLAARAKCVKITDRLLKLPHEEINRDPLVAHSLDILFEIDTVPQYAFTDDASKVGTPVLDFKGEYVRDENGDLLTWRSDLLIGRDGFSGIVYVDLNILDEYDVYATYTYKETHYTISSLVMNPILDPSLVRSTRVVYIIPRNLKNGNIDTQEASVRWLKVSGNGRILATNQDGTGGNESISFDTKITNWNGHSITGAIGLHYSLYKTCLADGAQVISPSATVDVSSTTGFPRSGWLRSQDASGRMRYFKYTDRDATSFTLSSVSQEVPSNGVIAISSGETIELVNFVDELTLQTRRDFSVESSIWQGTTGPSMLAQYFVVAELSVNPPHGIHALARIDVREDGGGVIEEKYDEAKQINPEVQWLNDFSTFDGQPYPGNAVMVVKLPITLLDDFSLEQIKAKVYESIPTGVYPLIRFYGYEPRIVSIVPGVDSIVVEWEKEGPEFMYNIWHARGHHSEDQLDFVLANSSPVFDGSSDTNTFTITGLTSGVPYIIKIDMQDRYYMWWYSYSGPNSIEGGLGLDENSPTPPFGNVSNFQFSTT